MATHAEVKRLHTPDAPDLASFQPEDPTDFALLVQVIAGPRGSEGEESFDVEVLTPQHLMNRLAATGPLSGRHMLLVARFDHVEIRRWIESAVSSCSCQSWREVAQRLSRIGRWEFEDYVE